jgi:hypothetical protein
MINVSSPLKIFFPGVEQIGFSICFTKKQNDFEGFRQDKGQQV